MTRERRSALGNRRDEILATAAQLFATSGFRLSLQEIADACGILAGSLYHHFDSKEAIVAELLARYRADLEALASRPQDSADAGDLDRIAGFAEAIVACATSHKAALLQTLYMAEQAGGASSSRFTPAAIVGKMESILRRAQAGGYLKSTADLPKLAIQLCESMFHFGLGTYHMRPEALHVPRTKCLMLLEGLAKHAPDNDRLDSSEAFRIAQEVIAGWGEPEDSDQLAALKAAARKQFSRRSFEAATIRDVASAANMSTSVIYRLAGSKDKLLDLVMQPYTAAVNESWDALLQSSSSTIEKLDAMIWININLLDRFSDESMIQIAWLREAPPQPWADFAGFAKRLRQLRDLLEVGESEGVLHQPGPGLDVRAHCLLELSWIPRIITLGDGLRTALAQARETLLRGAANR